MHRFMLRSDMFFQKRPSRVAFFSKVLIGQLRGFFGEIPRNQALNGFQILLWNNQHTNSASSIEGC